MAEPHTSFPHLGSAYHPIMWYLFPLFLSLSIYKLCWPFLALYQARFLFETIVLDMSCIRITFSNVLYGSLLLAIQISIYMSPAHKGHSNTLPKLPPVSLCHITYFLCSFSCGCSHLFGLCLSIMECKLHQGRRLLLINYSISSIISAWLLTEIK